MSPYVCATLPLMLQMYDILPKYAKSSISHYFELRFSINKMHYEIEVSICPDYIIYYRRTGSYNDVARTCWQI